MTCAVLITPLVDFVPKIKDCDYIGVDGCTKNYRSKASYQNGSWRL